MSKYVAFLVALGFVVWVIARDNRRRSGVSAALWIPTVWLLVLASRPVGVWLGMAPSGSNATEVYQSGSVVDRMFWLVLIVSGFLVLCQRQGRLRRILSNGNIKIFLVISAFWFISIVWSEFPFTSLKRWVKDVGHLIMALIVYTEEDPEEALQALLTRFAAVLVPFSVVAIKYFPEIGRTYHVWTWTYMYVGVAEQKNSLGMLSFTSFVYLVWEQISLKYRKLKHVKRADAWSRLAILAMCLYCLKFSDSASSLVGAVIGCVLVLLTNRKVFAQNWRSLEMMFVAGVLGFLLADTFFGLSEFFIVDVLGRDLTLTDRTAIWSIVLGFDTNPLLGVGYYSFWLGERLEFVWAERPGINQSHNGYLEAYLNGGFVILFLALVMIWKARARVVAKLVDGVHPIYGLKYSFLFLIVIHNLTEATFFRMSSFWTLFVMMSLDVPKKDEAPSEIESVTPPR